MTTTDQTFEQNRFADTFGYPKGRAVTKLKNYMTEYVQEFVKHSPFAVMATSNTTGQCDASPKGGKPGFVWVLDEKHLLFPDVAGNKLFQSYQNVDANPHIGLLFMIPGMNDTVRVNGKVTIVDKEASDQRNVDLIIVRIRRQLQTPAGNAHRSGRSLRTLPPGIQVFPAMGCGRDRG